MLFNVDVSISSYEHLEITSDSRHFNNGGEFKFRINNEDAISCPSDSYLLIEGKLMKEDGTDFPAGGRIACVKEGMWYLFGFICYQISNRDVERIENPGQVQNMLSYLLDSPDVNESKSEV